MYGPKSCGKATLLKKVRDDILADKKLRKRIKFFWYDLREQVFGGYQDVVEFLFPLKEKSLDEIGMDLGAG